MAKPATASKPAARGASPPAKPATQVATTSKSTALAKPAISFKRQAGAGMENVTSRELIIPRLTILQALSDEVKPKHAKYIKGAVVGNICDTGTGQLFGNELTFLPVYYSKIWIEWFPRSTGKGIASIHENDNILENCSPDADGRGNYLENKNRVVETHQLFGLNMSASRRRSFIGFTSTQIKKVRKLLTLANAERITEDNEEFCPPLFYRSYNMGIAEEGNAEGDWIGWKIERHLPILEFEGGDNAYADAISFHDSIKKGEAKADVSSMAPDAPASGDSDGGRM